MLNIFSVAEMGAGKGQPMVGRKLNHWEGQSKVLGLKLSAQKPG